MLPSSKLLDSWAISRVEVYRATPTVWSQDFMSVSCLVVVLFSRADLAGLPFSASERLGATTALYCPGGFPPKIVRLSIYSLVESALSSSRQIPQLVLREWHVDLTLHHTPKPFSTEGLLALGALAVYCQADSSLGKCTE